MSIEHDKPYDVIVVGGGHAGTEAAAAAARSGARTLLLTHNIETLGQMSCNPAFGGIGKGHLVKEIDALGGLMAKAVDRAGIQFRILNASKGPAVRATRAQADRQLYRGVIRHYLENQPNLEIFQQAVDDLILENNTVCGVVTQMGLSFYAKAVVLTVGTFLAGKIHVGERQEAGGRAGDPPSIALAERLRSLPFRVGRLKTGTPPRIDGKTLDFTVMTAQPGDTPTPVFSFLGKAEEHPAQVDCFITHTTSHCHDIIRASLHRSAMYSGAIEGIGPRYCPSIEDKITRFADKTSHQIFVEPEGLNTNEIYPNGISTSLPYDVQIDFVRAIKGFERAHITRPGYAIEYDFFDPRDLSPSLQTKFIGGLFFAGQINGTTGYEEAGAQGLVAGINAARYSRGQSVWYPRRDEAYIGVLIDDLVTAGTQEPYRMFTSRAEYRLLLREDNADLRLTAVGRQLGLIDDVRWKVFNEKCEAIEKGTAKLKATWVKPSTELATCVESVLQQTLPHEYSLYELLRRPELRYQDLRRLDRLVSLTEEVAVLEQIEIQAKYAGYIDRQQADIERLRKHEMTRLPADFDYASISGLSAEIIQKLSKHRPETLGLASRIPGVTPAAISLLYIYLKKRGAALHMSSHSEALQTCLEQGLDALAFGLTVTPAMKQALLRYISLIHRWNQQFNLTGIKRIEEMVSKHLLDSLSIAPFLLGDRILDVGSGAGLPGIPLAIIHPEKQVVLIDSVGKRTRFLTQVKLELGLRNVDVVNERVEAYRPGACFTTVVSRAFAVLKDMLDRCEHLCCKPGRILAMKGSNPAEEIEEMKTALSNAFDSVDVIPLSVPGLDAERHVVVIER